jgi:hypothetical protein
VRPHSLLRFYVVFYIYVDINVSLHVLILATHLGHCVLQVYVLYWCFILTNLSSDSDVLMYYIMNEYNKSLLHAQQDALTQYKVLYYVHLRIAPCSRNMLWCSECNIYTQWIGCEKGISIYYILFSTLLCLDILLVRTQSTMIWEIEWYIFFIWSKILPPANFEYSNSPNIHHWSNLNAIALQNIYFLQESLII